ncbi:FAD-dependent oxidoreductase [Streptomyces phaeofaciens JCM 4814]|uniref:Amine oxidase n=1 Tax=Streptomyces phaeofaciens TaxID=68254 RepID=A0A918HQU1_9ACTN|nr:FAD-dependent oxidoreductase [Streptomyces phaeofaciens]GGT96115.1 amine oxidase [Streptomyces phaeofaciens]
MPRTLHPLRSDKIVILGAGPCGLACADELTRLGHRNWTLLEAAPAAGGLAASVVDPVGFTWDLGGHVVFSHFGEFDRLLATLFAPSELLHHDRSSYVRFRDRWVPYPFQQHLHHLPAEDAEACLHDLLVACQRREQGLPVDADFSTWLHGMYGSGLVERFFGPYNSKVWAMSPEQMASSWVAERLAPVSPDEIMAAFSGAAPPARRWGPNSTFVFPARGGTGEIWRRLAARLDDGRLRTGARVVMVDPVARTVTLADGERVGFDHLVATGPLNRIAAMTAGVPGSVQAAAARLRHTTVAMVGLGYRAPTIDERSWLYFPQADVPFYRATNFSKYAPANVPGADTNTFSAWMTETSMLPRTRLDFRRLISTCDQSVRRQGLVPEHAPLASAHLELIEYAYPVPTVDRDAALAEVVPWLEARRIYPRGRFGTWRYEIGNMDHAVKMGLDIARRLVNGTVEGLLPPASVAVNGCRA